MHTPLCSPTDQGIYVPACPDGAPRPCVSGSMLFVICPFFWSDAVKTELIGGAQRRHFYTSAHTS
eukprot:4255436-Prymnesium_polylepis.1